MIISSEFFNSDKTSEILDEKVVFLNNTNVPNFVEAPEIYESSYNFYKGNIFEIEKNTIYGINGNKNYTFTTEYFLPTCWKAMDKSEDPSEYWYNCQSIAIDGKYMYILSSSGYNQNKGFIVRYDMEVLNKYNANNENGSWVLRELGYKVMNRKNLTKDQQALKQSMKIGPIFNTGHGQSLSYDPKTKSLWMWQDDGSKSSKLKLMRIDKDTLKPNRIYKVSAKLNNRKINTFHNLDFDNDGNFYTEYVKRNESNPSGSSTIFMGNISNDTVKIKPLITLENRPGTHPQSIAVNPLIDRLYLVSDGAIYTMPIKKLLKYNLTKDDLEYTVFNTGREFEGISFDSEGNSYLLILRGTEILKSSLK